MSVDVDRLRELFEYNPESGLFVRRIRTSKGTRIGQIAGTIDKAGYVVIQIGPRIYKAHRLAWLYMTGEWPKEAIDHKNLENGDNRWVNLREATRSQNGANRGPQANNTSGVKGVVWNRSAKKWEAAGYVSKAGKKKRFYLGVYASKEEAGAAYMAWAKEKFGDFARQ